MAESSSIQISQGYDVLPPKTGKAYPILCEEWNYLKDNISAITERPNIYHTIGSVLLGACLSTFTAIITGSFPDQNPSNGLPKIIIAWSVVSVTFIVGIVCIYFGHEKRKLIEKKASDILSQMELIEKRYKQKDSP